MSHVLRLVRVDHFAKSIYSCYYRRLLCPLSPLQLRYTSGMAENKQQPQGILEKVKNLALGIKRIFFKLFLLFVGDTPEAKQKKDKKKDKHSNEVYFLPLNTLVLTCSWFHVQTSLTIASKSLMNIGQSTKLRLQVQFPCPLGCAVKMTDFR
jgi:hypothetical protein